MSISETIESIGFLTALRESALVYPIVMTTHLACIAVFGGMILMTDLRLLGVVTDRSVTDVVNRFRLWKRVGFCIMVTMGVLLASSEAVKYAGNPYFRSKMSLLVFVGVHAAIFRPRVYNNTAEIDRAPFLPGRAKLAGARSLLIWLGVLAMGGSSGITNRKRGNRRPRVINLFMLFNQSAEMVLATANPVNASELIFPTLDAA